MQHISNRMTSKDNKTSDISLSNTQRYTNIEVLTKKPKHSIQLSKQKRSIAPNQFKELQRVFVNISESQSSKIKR